MSPTDALTSAIIKELRRVYLCTTEELCALLPEFSSGQIAAHVERLIQAGAIASRSSDPSRFILWLPPTGPARRVIDSPAQAGSQHVDAAGFDHGMVAEETSSTSGLFLH